MTVPSFDDILMEFKGAGDELKMAELALQSHLYRQAVSSAYYAVYHAAKAVLWLRGRDMKSHQGLARLFAKEYVGTGEIEKRYQKILDRGREQRQKADYDFIHFDVSAEQAAERLNESRDFVERMNILLQAARAEREE